MATENEQKEERVRERQEAMRSRLDGLKERAQDERRRHGWVDAAFEVADRDAEVGGGIIAGALAFRLFIWLLPFGLVFVGGLGVIAGASAETPYRVAAHLGLDGIISSSLQSSSQSKSPWYALLVGVPILLWVTRTVLRVLIGTHRLAWGDVRGSRPKPTFVEATEFLGVFLAYVALAVLAAWARSHSAAVGIVVTVGVIAGFIGLWLGTSLRLPHRAAGWVDLLPGATVVGIGLGILQVLAAYLFGPYALQKQGTYGALGLAAALLLGLFVLGRLLIGGAVLNATLWERKTRRG